MPKKKSKTAINEVHYTLQDRARTYKKRQEQLDLAVSMYDALHQQTNHISEAPTGIGKSLAILMTAAALIKNKEGEDRPTIVIGTANNTLLEQYVKKDLPFFEKAMKGTEFEFTWGRIKGRTNYLCRSRFENKRGTAATDGLPKDVIFERAHDLFADMPIGDWLDINVDDNCNSKQCHRFEECDLYREKDRVQNVDVIVTNYDMILLDLIYPNAQLLPVHHYLVLDEGHALQEKAMKYYGSEITRFGIQRQLAKLGIDRMVLINIFKQLDAAMKEIDKGDMAVIKEHSTRYRGILQELREYLKNVVANATVGNDPLAKKAKEVLERHTQTIEKILDNRDGTLALAWLEPGKNENTKICFGPIFVDRMLRRDLFNDRIIQNRGDSRTIPSKPVAITSATIATAGGGLDLYAKAIGCDEYEKIVCKVPFDYKANCHIVVYKTTEDGINKPSHPRWMPWAARQSERLINSYTSSGGGAFVLCTSRKSMDYLGSHIRNVYGAQRNILVQDGSRSVPEIIKEFKAAGNAILVGTSSFWEGVSVEGDALKLVILDKIPFPVPSDPVFKAREAYFKKNNCGDSFKELMLYPAIIRLKQGFGRLIRTETDSGVVACLDQRMQNAGYRFDIFNSLPVCPIISV